MNITVKTDLNSTKFKKFMFEFLPEYMIFLYISKSDKKRIKQLDLIYDIDCNKIIIYALKHMYKTKIGNYMYTIGVNKNLKYKGQFIMELIHKITYGDLTHKGYPILLQIFKEVSERINIIYEEWLEKWQ